MGKMLSWPLILILATLIHIDWHFARPLHHRLSLGWSSHWLFAVAFFAAAGCYIARRWPKAPWRAAAWNVGIALLVAQVVEPILEEASEFRLAYSVPRERWLAFFEAVAAGVPALVLGVWLSLRSMSKVLKTDAARGDPQGG